MTFKKAYEAIDNKYPTLTEWLKLARCASIPETEDKEENIIKLVRKKIKEEGGDVEGAVKDILRRYKMPLQVKKSNFKNYI